MSEFIIKYFSPEQFVDHYPELVGLEMMDLRRACVSKAGRPVHVSPREFHLLRCLVERAGTPVSRAELLDHAWGRDAMPGPQTVDVHIAWLRHKLEQDPRRPALIRTVHGIGYVLSDPDAA